MNESLTRKSTFLNKKVQVRVETMAATLLLVVLATLTILLTASTGRAYQYIAQGGSSAQDIRTGLLFITTRVRQSDNAQVTLEASPFGGKALVITQHVGGKDYQEWIYFTSGELKEVLMQKGSKILPSASTTVCKLSGLQFDMVGNLITVTAKKSGADSSSLPVENEESISISLRR